MTLCCDLFKAEPHVDLRALGDGLTSSPTFISSCRKYTCWISDMRNCLDKAWPEEEAMQCWDEWDNWDGKAHL